MEIEGVRKKEGGKKVTHTKLEIGTLYAPPRKGGATETILTTSRKVAFRHRMWYHMLARPMHVSTTFYFKIIFYVYQNTKFSFSQLDYY